MTIPSIVPNWIEGRETLAVSGQSFAKINPADGRQICMVARSDAVDIAVAVAAAKRAQVEWAALPPVRRGQILFDLAGALQRRSREVAEIVALETGKSLKDALGETNGAAQLGFFYAGEGQRLYGRTTTSGQPNRSAMTIRQPVGVAGLIIAANTPIANVAWKVFPALICGNGVVLKSAEDTPLTAWIFGRIAGEAGLPQGILNIVHGLGEEAGAPLVDHDDVGVVSFTGSTTVGREIAVKAGQRLAKVSLELGGKNPLVVCDDADLENAAKWILLSAFSNAGQRCAAASRIIVLASVYDRLREMLRERIGKMRIGTADDDDYGPVINAGQLEQILAAIDRAVKQGGILVTGGQRFLDAAHRNGFFLQPTLLEKIDPDWEISTRELFGPVACLYKVSGFEEALALANRSPYGLTACIHTASIHRALRFVQGVQAGVVMVNAGTYGSEPHMPFGGVKQSGNGTREPGTEALDIYSDLKDVYMQIDPEKTA